MEHRAPNTRFSDYVDALTKFEPMSRIMPDMGDPQRDARTSKNSIIEILQSTFVQLRMESPSAERMLRTVSLCGRAPIPRSLLPNISAMSTDIDIDEDTHTLARYSLLVRDAKTGLFKTSSLVQAAMKPYMQGDDLKVWIEMYTLAMHRIFAKAGWINWDLWRDLYPHAEMLLEHGRPADDTLLEWADVLHGASWYARQTGHHKTAHTMLDESIEVKRRSLGPNDPSTLTSLEALTYAISEWCR
jgi:hypothetical protein